MEIYIYNEVELDLKMFALLVLGVSHLKMVEIFVERPIKKRQTVMTSSILGEYLFNEALTGVLVFGSIQGILTWKPNHHNDIN